MGGRSFLPTGMVTTFAHAVAHRAATKALGGAGLQRKRKRRRKTSTAKKVRKAAKSGVRKPKPGTKAWMAYIRGKRKKK